MVSEEQKRIDLPHDSPIHPWRKWGTYVSERSWGTVREDYSQNGDPWNYFPFEEASRRAYRWGEDAIAGICDRYQILVLAPAFWNGKDPILKERLFGVNSYQGNHGEDVKEYYFHDENTPTHSYASYVYRYPHEEFPYRKLIEENQKRDTKTAEYELVDTGILEGNKYFDIKIEYAKVDQEDLFMKVKVKNCSPDTAATIHIIPQLWFRDTWSWKELEHPKPFIKKSGNTNSYSTLEIDDLSVQRVNRLNFEYFLGKRYFYAPSSPEVYFTENETSSSAEQKWAKDGIQRILLNQEEQMPSRLEQGSKAALHYTFENLPPLEERSLLFRFSDKQLEKPFEEAESILTLRKKEADEFYEEVTPPATTEEEKHVFKKAISGLLWNKQIYLFDVKEWLDGDPFIHLSSESRKHIRNVHWKHLNSKRVLCMPDKWEYPWFAAWDHSFHCITLGLVDIDFAKEQLWLLLFDQFQHPNGQIPAYEWEFSDLNPPVQAWALLKLFELEKEKKGKGDLLFLERCFHKLMINFAWWVNKVDSSGNNVFEGGFLGLDNITVVDRSLKLLDGSHIEQSDGTGWMAMFCLNLMKIAIEIAKNDKVYEYLATKFFQHFIYIAAAMNNITERKYVLWSEEDHFFYDALVRPDKSFTQFKVRSMVGVIPLFSIEIITQEEMDLFPEFKEAFLWFIHNRKELTSGCVHEIEEEGKKRYVLTVMDKTQMRHVLNYLYTPDEFRAPYGVRSLSKYHEKHPFIYENNSVSYEPNESLFRIKGGNSNWRGPIWLPTNFLLICSLLKLDQGLGSALNIQSEGKEVTLKEMIDTVSGNLLSLFMPNNLGYRPFWGAQFPYKDHPDWKDYILFYEYFNPDTGRGLGASHQTGWTSLIANILKEVKNR